MKRLVILLILTLFSFCLMADLPPMTPGDTSVNYTATGYMQSPWFLATAITPTDQNVHVFQLGTWSTGIDVTGQTAHFAGLNIHLDSNTSVAKDVAAARFRVDTDAAATLTAINPVEIRASIAHAVGGHTALGVSSSVDGAVACTGDYLAGYFNIQGTGAITSSNHVNVLEATNTNTSETVKNVAHFTQNATGGTVVDVTKIENIAGTCTSLLEIARTAGTVTNGLIFTGTMTNHINTDTGTLSIAGVTQAGIRRPADTYDATGTIAVGLTLSGKSIVATYAGTSTATIVDPTAASVGVVYEFLQTVDQNLVVQATTADCNCFIADNVLTSDKVSLATASHKIGGGIKVIGIQTGAATYKWFATAMSPTEPLTVEAAD
jgi:hypothetical protein